MKNRGNSCCEKPLWRPREVSYLMLKKRRKNRQVGPWSHLVIHLRKKGGKKYRNFFWDSLYREFRGKNKGTGTVERKNSTQITLLRKGGGGMGVFGGKNIAQAP